MDSPEAVLQTANAAYNAHDVDAYLATFTPAATFGQLGGRILLDSRQAMQGFYQEFFATRPTVSCEIRERSIMGSYVVELQEITGEGQAPMQAMVISEVQEGRIARVWYAPLGGSPHGHSA